MITSLCNSLSLSLRVKVRKSTYEVKRFINEASLARMRKDLLDLSRKSGDRKNGFVQEGLDRSELSETGQRQANGKGWSGFFL